MKRLLLLCSAFLLFLLPLSFSQLLGCNPGDAECIDAATYHVCTQQAIWGEIQRCGLGAHCVNETLKTSGACKAIATPVCTPGDMRCVGSATYEVCDEYGQWGGIQACPGGQVCDDGQCVQPQPECSSQGQTRCSPANPNTVEICNSNFRWVYWKSCALGCYGGECKGCTSGDRQCFNGANYQVCGSDGRWGAPTSCPPNYVCVGNGNCAISPEEKCDYPGQVKCSPYNSDLLLRCTESYMWGTQQICNMGCKSNACAVCTNGQAKCANPNGYVICTSSGQWGYYTDCPTGYYCIGGSCQTTPANRCSTVGTKRCSPSDSSMVQTCGSSYTYQDSVKCPLGCNNGACMECQPGVQVCSGATSFKVCSPSGMLSADNPCPTNFVCGNGTCVAAPECNSGARKCIANDVYECMNSKWRMFLACPSGTDCAESTGTAYCQQEQVQPVKPVQNNTQPVQPVQPVQPQPASKGLEGMWGVFAGIAIVLAVALGYVLLKKGKK